MTALVPSARQRSRGPWNELHEAAFLGSIKRSDAILAKGCIDIDQGSQNGDTPLMIAADQGFPSMTSFLLSKGADVSASNDTRYTALHNSARNGYLEATKMLVKAGANLETRIVNGATALHMSATGGHSKVMGVLIEAGAKVNSCLPNGQTPLHGAAGGGHMDAVKMLIRAKADPSLGTTVCPGRCYLPLHAATLGGHAEVVRELIGCLGVAGCGGETGIRCALHLAAKDNNVALVAAMFDGGVVNTGQVLMCATFTGSEPCVKFLLQQQRDKEKLSAYVNFVDTDGTTPLLGSIASLLCSPRVVRLLLDAGADTTLAARFLMSREREIFHGTPLALTARFLNKQKTLGTSAYSKEQLNRLEGIRHLLLQAGAVHAVSWLWASESRCIANSTRRATKTRTLLTQLRTMMPMMRRQAGARRVVWTAAFRWVVIV
ncbi:unnamed protein product, partial [Hapterophycus canaliculatus]